MSAAFRPDGQRFTTSTAHAARIWSIATGHELARFDALDAACVMLSPDGAKLAIIDGGTAHVEIQDSATRNRLGLVSCDGRLFRITFDHASARLATNCEAVVELWNLRGEHLARLAGHQNMIRALMFSPDDRQLASGSLDQTFRLWDLASSRELAQLTSPGVPNGVEFDGTGTRMVTVTSDRVARLWDTTTQQLVRSFEHSSAVQYAALSPDGGLLAAGTRDGIVSIWDAATSQLIAEIPHPGQVTWVAFSPDGTHLLSVGTAHRAIVSRIERETRSPDIVAAFVRCRVPYRLNETRLESATPSCDHR
jgi:WD40 repeat protein